MATVHIGRLVGPVGFTRIVAIKRLHDVYAQDPEFVSMFVDEARIAARVQHPNVVQTLDVLATNGELLLVMEYVHGEPLSVLIRGHNTSGKKIPVAIASGIVSQVLQGLHAAHEAKDDRGQPLEIVHRDVSPQNVIVGADGLARVLDFGIAKAANRSHTTQAGQVRGKISYLAPERIFGIATRASDLFSVGVVLWETLTARNLFKKGKRDPAYEAINDTEIPPPSRHRPDLPDGMDELVLRALARDPRRRFATAREMSLALEAVAPAAGQATIGAWLEEIASSTLRDRARLIETNVGTTSTVAPVIAAPIASDAAIETVIAPDPTRIVPHPAPTVTAPIVSDPRAETVIEADSTQVRASPAPTPQAPAAIPRGLIGLVIVLLVVVIALAIASEVPSAEPPAPSTPEKAAAVEPVVTPAEEAPSLDEQDAVEEAPPVRSDNTPRPKTKDREHHRRRHARPAPASTAKPSPCDVPYTYDAAGIKRYKPECL